MTGPLQNRPSTRRQAVRHANLDTTGGMFAAWMVARTIFLGGQPCRNADVKGSRASLRPGRRSGLPAGIIQTVCGRFQVPPIFQTVSVKCLAHARRDRASACRSRIASWAVRLRRPVLPPNLESTPERQKPAVAGRDIKAALRRPSTKDGIIQVR